MSDPVARLNAALEGRYRVERELGEGGMATVYRRFISMKRPTARLLVVLILLVCGGDVGRGAAQARQAMPQIAFWNGTVEAAGLPNPDIYVISADGGEPKRLTDDPASDVFPSWSPDGQQIAFMRSRLRSSEIYVMDADGGNQRSLIGGRVELTNNLTPKGGYASWSPDGARIVFTSRESGNPEIHVIDVDGNNERNLTDNPAGDILPEWSPDGMRILFGSNRDGNFEIYVMDADGGNQNNLTRNAASDSFSSWSPDGSRILFGSDRDGGGIYVMEADGSNQTRLTDHPTDLFASWSPDGGRIVFVSERDLTTPVAFSELGHGEVYVMNADGSNIARLTDNSDPDVFPSWSPDGQQILFMRSTQGPTGIYVMDADGMNQRRLTGGDGPAWSPVPPSRN